MGKPRTSLRIGLRNLELPRACAWYVAPCSTRVVPRTFCNLLSINRVVAVAPVAP
jgi:hypothetical protein